MREATAAELARWDELVLGNPDGGHILQSRLWGDFKARHRWQPKHLVYETGGRELFVLVLTRNFPGFGQLWYAPKGPGVAGAGQLGDVVTQTTQRGGAFCVKWEPELLEDEVDMRQVAGGRLVRALNDIQANKATITVDLRPSEEAILATFKPKTRYNVRLAARKGVQVDAVASSADNLATMYALLAAAQERAGFLIRPREYYLDYWTFHADRQLGQLFFARLEDEVIAGAYVTRFGTKGWYKDGGSLRQHANVMAPHLLQWEVMRWLRARDVTSYDLLGVPPRRHMSPTHPLHGLVQFKSGFSPEVTEYVGTWDQPLRRSHRLWATVGERFFTVSSERLRHEPLF
jgi:lipid II:glycine glycyltransferase (peptidoglycan interpeptide bridge formation enzyme)